MSFWRPSRQIYADFSRGVDFDDPEYGFKEEDKDPDKVWSQLNPSSQNPAHI